MLPVGSCWTGLWESGELRGRDLLFIMYVPCVFHDSMRTVLSFPPGTWGRDMEFHWKTDRLLRLLYSKVYNTDVAEKES